MSVEHFRQSSARGTLVPGSSGDSQDPDDNSGPPRKQLPGDKIGDNSSDDEQEKKKKKEGKKDDNSTKSRIVRVTEVAVRNINQVSTFIFFPLLLTMT